MKAGDRVTLEPESGAIVPAGSYTVSRVNPDGSFHVGGNTAVWPKRLRLASGSSDVLEGKTSVKP